MPRLLALFGPRRGLSRDLDGRLVAGRSLDAGLHLLDEKVSREHCAFEPQAGPQGTPGPSAWTVRDLGSRNGTWVNGARIQGAAQLQPGDEVGVGETVLVFDPPFDALPARDGESTLVLTRAGLSAPKGPVSGGAAEPGASDRAIDRAEPTHRTEWDSALRQAGGLALAVAAAADPEQAARLLAEAVQRLLAPRTVAVLVLGPGGIPRPILCLPRGATLAVPRELVDASLSQSRPLAQEEAQAEPERTDQTTRLRLRPGQVLSAPFRSGGRPAGALCLARTRPFDEAEQALAGALAAAVGPALAQVCPGEPAPDDASAAGRRSPSGARPGDDLPVAESASMQAALRLARAAAQVPSTVLIQGETGTGKEEVARAIHRLGPRARGPFVAVNCGAIPAELAESELFGHERGAFTGAAAARAGLFEQADGGTLLLDELGELSPSLQVKLLRVLQERAVTRVGGRGPLPVDVRVVAATNRDLAELVRAGTFREDLFWRVAVLRIHLPPLRERPEDLLPLAQRLLERLSRLLGRRAEGFTDEARSALERCPWPGNGRQLANALERALVLRSGAGPIELAELPADVASPAPIGPAAPATSGGAAAAPGAEPGRTLAALVQGLEREQIVLALQRSRGVKSAAAQALGISRPTLDRKIAEYGIDLFRREGGP